MTKQNYDITRMQREDLAKAYRDVYPKCWSQQEVWDKIAKHPAPRYYVSAKEAYEKLRRMVGVYRQIAMVFMPYNSISASAGVLYGSPHD